jgi:transcriptional regulator ATRX
VIVVCPLSTVFNWENEFRIWLPGESFVTLNVCELASCKTNKAKEEKITNSSSLKNKTEMKN